MAYAETFKLEVLRDLYVSGLTPHMIGKKYKISPISVRSWQKSFPLDSKALNLPSEIQESYQMSKQGLSREEQLEQQVIALQRALELEKMRSRAFETLIEIAEREEGISILKKDGAKQ